MGVHALEAPEGMMDWESSPELPCQQMAIGTYASLATKALGRQQIWARIHPHDVRGLKITGGYPKRASARFEITE